MTEEIRNTVALNTIWVNREARQRVFVKPEAIEEMAASIQEIGLLHPPVITREGELIVGETRLEAMRFLGWEHIPVTYTDQLDPVKLHLMELEENVRRTDLSWQDQTMAVAKYHKLMVELNPEQTQNDTAKKLNVDPANMGKKLDIAKEIEAGNEKVINAEKLSKAATITAKIKQRRAAAELSAISDESPSEFLDAPIKHESFLNWAPDYEGPKFNFIHCDFPYGVDADKHNQGAADTQGGYEDSKEIYFELLDCFFKNQDYFIEDQAHCMFWYSMDYYKETVDLFEAHGWKVNPFPLIWHKSDNTGILPDRNRGPRRTYETALIATRGDRFIVEPVANSIGVPSDSDKVHMSQKPRTMLSHFFRMFVDEYTTILDPTCGSANALAVAKNKGASRILGLEQDKDFYNRAKENYNAN